MSLEAAILINRFGFGARPGDISRLTGTGRESLYAQIGVAPTNNPALEGLASTEDVANLIAERRAMRGTENADMTAIKEKQRAIQRSDALSALNAPVMSDDGLSERLVRFWTNFFTVSTRKGEVRTLAGAFEREAIRPNIYGSFTDLLLAVERHPAMLLYYDNVRSQGPSSRVGMRRDSGLNENLAREILELHTVGSGFTQDDVTAFAETLTGWTIDITGERTGTPGSFAFVQAFHEPGTRTILGRTYTSMGEDQGIDVLTDLSRDPATYRRIAERLALYFHSDTPSETLITQLASVLANTNGDLAATVRAMVDHPEALSTEPEKARDPIDYVIAILRAYGTTKVTNKRLVALLNDMGQRPYAPLSPKGWPDAASAWLTSQGLMRRAELAQWSASRFPWDDAVARMEDLFGPRLSNRTRAAILAAPNIRDATALAFASPEFQYR